eukprot:TRINITY_DN8777_c0_g1_i2.p1 TRINITY_DN8777_c0_g1~~TRINITY_DN8777_c0_g1_i2.p1  ORF type:complete len:491 (-),score=70.89 TRINITY_DN8777_c0_g1_i2:327-1799(-)
MSFSNILRSIEQQQSQGQRPFGIMRRKEDLTSQLWRYRGVIAVGTVVFLVFIMILRGTSTQKSYPDLDLADKSANLQARANEVRSQNELGAQVIQSSELQYAIVFDAGSTGSRVHVYEFQSGEQGQFTLINELFEQLKPGLSSYAGKPQDAANSLKPLIEKAIERVPETQQRSTKLVLKATAGLRMLEGNQAEDILAAVRKLFDGTPFQVPAQGVEIMEGQDEGAFAWLTLNYLLETLGGSSTVAAIDLGGGSVQQAFMVEDDKASKAPEGYIKVVQYGSQKFNVYVHSYLNYGLMAGRAEVLKVTKDEGSNCLVKGTSGSYKYNSMELPLVSKEPKFDECSDIVESALKVDGACTYDKCSFSGAWAGSPPSDSDTYISSYFFDRAVDAGIIKDEKLPTADIKVKDFKTKAEKACNLEVANVQQEFSKVSEELAPYLCLDLSYCYELLTDGFSIPEDSDVTLVKRINYNGMEIEAAWPLGVALGLLSVPS